MLGTVLTIFEQCHEYGTEEQRRRRSAGGVERWRVDVPWYHSQRISKYVHVIFTSRYANIAKPMLTSLLTYVPTTAPTALSNGPTILECQIETITAIVSKLEQEEASSIEATHSAEVGWKDALAKVNDQTLFPFTSSWWTGGNIPGKQAENMNYIGGIDNYEKECLSTLDGWVGFEVKK